MYPGWTDCLPRRRILSYVLLNQRKHAAERGGRPPEGLDAFSSAAWFEGWYREPREAAR